MFFFFSVHQFLCKNVYEEKVFCNDPFTESRIIIYNLCENSVYVHKNGIVYVNNDTF